jgi:hypothetical protein
LFTPARPNQASLSVVSTTSKHIPSIATSRRPANQQPGVPGPANGRATRRNSASTGSNPNRTRAWKIPDFDGNLTGSASAAHPNPSVNNDNTSSYEPSECNAIPIEK